MCFKKRKNVGKVGWCDAKTLGLSRGHFVYIRSIKHDKCDINTFSSIEDKSGKIELPKVDYIKKGLLYAVPTADLTLPRFSGVDKRVIKNIPLGKIKHIGGRYSIKKRHKWYIKKYLK